MVGCRCVLVAPLRPADTSGNLLNGGATTPMPADLAPVNRLKELRENINLSQDQVALLLGLTGAAVSRHEGRERRLDLATVRLYANLYKVTTAELFVVYARRSAKASVGV